MEPLYPLRRTVLDLHPADRFEQPGDHRDRYCLIRAEHHRHRAALSSLHFLFHPHFQHRHSPHRTPHPALAGSRSVHLVHHSDDLLGHHFLFELGLIELPIRFLYTEKAVFIGLIHVFLPFMILPLYASIEKIEQHLEEAAQDLGASRIQTFFRVNLPLSLPGISTGCLLVFILTVGSYITPDLLGGPSEIMISNVIQKEYYPNFRFFKNNAIY